jgi:hypothetical protein
MIESVAEYIQSEARFKCKSHKEALELAEKVIDYLAAIQMKKQELLRALQNEIRRHDFTLS